MKTAAITITEYQGFQRAYDFFNRELFDGSLPTGSHRDAGIMIGNGRVKCGRLVYSQQAPVSREERKPGSRSPITLSLKAATRRRIQNSLLQVFSSIGNLFRRVGKAGRRN